MARPLLALAIVLAVSACDRARLDMLERRVETLETNEGQHGPASPAIVDPAPKVRALEEEVAKAKLEREVAEQQLASIVDRFGVLQARRQALLDEAEPPGTKPSKRDKIGIPICDEYIATYRRCIEEKVPEAARQSMLDALEQTVDAWSAAASTPALVGLDIACTAAFDAAAKATEAMGCKW